jgi:hypothetical protein
MIPARLETGRRRFERWRRTRKSHARIPERLWMSAVRLAGAYGLCRTARTLGLDYYALKKRVNSIAPHDSSGQQTSTSFVELLPAQHAGMPECIVELEHPRGAKMRIRLTGHQSSEVVTAVSQVFFGIES